MSESKVRESKAQVIRFIIFLCTTCGLILSLLATSLQRRQKEAIQLNQIKELLVAAKVLSPSQETFLISKGKDRFTSANFDLENQMLIANSKPKKPSNTEIFAIARSRIIPLLVDDRGDFFTFDQAEINYESYLEENEKTGYAKLPLKLVYKILDNYPITSKKDSIATQSYVFPINGFGLWDAIYGYIALKPDGDRVIGTTWYEQKETPGLGAEISTSQWQKQFFGKLIFQKNADGSTDLNRGAIGIIVVKGVVQEVMGSSFKSQSAVDGLTGATETGKGVTAAYRDSLTPYRKFLTRINKEQK